MLLATVLTWTILASALVGWAWGTLLGTLAARAVYGRPADDE